MYRELRRAARETLAEVRREGCTAFKIDGKDGMVVIFGLTSLEEGVHVEKNPAAAFPDVRSDGTGFVLEWPG